MFPPERMTKDDRLDLIVAHYVLDMPRFGITRINARHAGTVSKSAAAFSLCFPASSTMSPPRPSGPDVATGKRQLRMDQHVLRVERSFKRMKIQIPLPHGCFEGEHVRHPSLVLPKAPIPIHIPLPHFLGSLVV